MGSYLVSVPEIADSDLVFDEAETRQILKFFYPASTARITGMAIDDDARRLAQTMLIAAIDGSYSMGFVQALFTSAVRPGSGIAPLAKKLGRKFVRHWYKHATQEDLMRVKIYDSVRSSIAVSLKHRFADLLSETVSRLRWRRALTMYVLVESANPYVWA